MCQMIALKMAELCKVVRLKVWKTMLQIRGILIRGLYKSSLHVTRKSIQFRVLFLPEIRSPTSMLPGSTGSGKKDDGFHRKVYEN